MPQRGTSTNSSGEEEVYSDPFGALAVKHGRAVKDCVELYLSNKGITKLAGFNRFVNLDTLWLNDNAITRLNNLDECMRIKRLYAHNNNLVTLQGSLVTFTFLDTLIIYNNNLQDLHSQLEVLGQMRHLEELDMHGNPLAEETNYRLHVIKNLPWLHVLDRHVITDEERELAANVKTAAELADEDEKPKKSTVKRKPTEKQLQAQAQLNNALDLIRETVKIKRILLKDHFMHLDPRKEWVIPEDEFTQNMNLYGLDLLAKNVNGDFDAYDLLLSKYKAKTPVRSATMGRDMRVTERNVRFIDYVKFCMDIEPKFSSRDLDNTLRLAAKARDMRLGPDLDDKVPLSQTVKNLRDSVSMYKRGLYEKAQADRRAMVKLSEENLRKQRQMKVPMAKSEKDFEVPREKLDAWEMTEFRGMITDTADYDKKVGNCGVEGLREALDMMILCGRIAITSDIDAFIEEERQAKLALAEFDDVDPENDNVEEEKVDPISRFLEELPKEKDGKVKMKEFLTAVVDGAGEVPPMTWRNTTHAEAKEKSKKLYAEAKTLNHRVALMGDSDPAMRESNTAKIKVLTKWAQKLERIASHDIEHKFNRKLGPRTSLRADTYVVKEQIELMGVQADDEGLSDDEEEGKTEDDTDEMWEKKEKERKRIKDRTETLRKKFGVKEDVQGRYRVLQHTRRPKSFTKKGSLLVTNVSKFDRSDQPFSFTQTHG
ncbi:hypothetical protein TL16_g04153 [Triparma laevis f. inornata]|uniref:Uncharacterized protein n=2 Tax=Triparma laevis TaxID=1534972 RepID=A0A9W7F587_9STRA|nr:hypothetical protein TL16_g04153 [Triparma laevis f. inornata]GMI01853.1 hypothetical protein TrLO_g3156 [Triparma laevis f. longispina]